MIKFFTTAQEERLKILEEKFKKQESENEKLLTQIQKICKHDDEYELEKISYPFHLFCSSKFTKKCKKCDKIFYLTEKEFLEEKQKEELKEAQEIIKKYTTKGKK